VLGKARGSPVTFCERYGFKRTGDFMATRSSPAGDRLAHAERRFDGTASGNETQRTRAPASGAPQRPGPCPRTELVHVLLPPDALVRESLDRMIEMTNQPDDDADERDDDEADSEH
jgi:hypothetical protein